MSLPDPMAVTIGGTTISLPRTNVGEHMSEYSSSDGLTAVTASHQEARGGRKRRMIRLDVQKMSPDPFDDTRTREVSMATYVVFDLPDQGFTPAEAKAAFDGFRAMLAANSDAVVVKVLGGES